jgi:hypothetical protein
MGRPAHIIRPRELHLHIPADKMEQLDAFLWSSASNSVPKGAYSRFFKERIEDFFAKMAEVGNSTLTEMTDV